MKRSNAKTDMLEHSEAKIELYATYLSMYLNILSRVPSVKGVLLFDLLAGEGIYEDGSKGSALTALEVIRDHYFANNQSCPDMCVWFNDNGLSRIENGVYKIDRVRRFSADIFTPPNVSVECFREDYDEILPCALKKLQGSKNVKGLFFIDPYGYKEIDPDELKEILANRDAEVFLFLPASHMYRFAEKALHSSFPGGKPLERFLRKLFGSETPHFDSVYDFIRQLKEKLGQYIRDVFVDTFTLARDASNVYCLIFFTNHIRGFEKMIEAKWNLDKQSGRGHTFQKSKSPYLFSEIELSGYPTRLRKYIAEGTDPRTNRDLYRFGLENGFLPKHTNEVLRDWKRQGVLEVLSLDGNLARSNYISYGTDRIVGFRLKDNGSVEQEG
jgi:three-Cys-motif partner protein